MGKYIKAFDTTAEMKQYFEETQKKGAFLFWDKSKVGLTIGDDIDGGTAVVKQYKPELEYFTFTSMEDGSVLKVNHTYNHWKNNTFSLNVNDTGWVEYNNISQTITLDNGEFVRVRGYYNKFGGYTGGQFYGSTGKFKISGSIMSIVTGNPDSTELKGQIAPFGYTEGIIYDASELLLPATTLADDAYYGLFKNCTNLSKAPAVLPAITVGSQCYRGMFYNCTSLTTAPEIRAITMGVSCCYEMFYGCTSLTEAPELHATTLGNYCCYYMFEGCTALTTAPVLYATTIGQSTYHHMFENCSSLSTLEIYSISGFQSAYYMCSNCTSLNKVITHVSEWNTTNANHWLGSVPVAGDFYNLGGATIPRGTSGIPTYWTEHTSLDD